MKYDAFISYRHLERDMYVAKKVHKGLETTKIPKRLRKELGRKRINRVFRDQEELPVGSDLGANIEAALLVSDFLIVICSPQTKESAWVMKEIDTFIEMHGREHILAVLVEGEPGDSFPPQLLMDENGNPVEPLAADVRGATKKEVNKKLKTETMRLAAAILGVDYDDLKRRQRERAVKRNMGIAVGVATLGLAIGAFSAYNLARINQEYQQKLVNESKIIANKSKEVLNSGDRKNATLIAMEGMPIDEDRPLVPESMYALSNALGVYDSSSMLGSDIVIHADYPVKKLSSNLSTDIIAILDESGKVYVWDLYESELLYEINPEYKYGFTLPVYDTCVAADGETVCVISENAVRGYDKKGNIVYEYVPEKPIMAAKSADYGDAVAFEYASEEDSEFPETVAILDPVTGEELAVYQSDLETPFSDVIEFDMTGNLLAVGHVPMEGQENYITIYYWDEQEQHNLHVGNDLTLSIGFEIDQKGDDFMYGWTVNSIDSAAMEYNKNVKSELQYFYKEESEPSWATEISYYQDEDKHACNKISTMCDGEPGSGDFTVVCAGNNLYVVDLTTGEIKAIVTSEYYYSQLFATGNYFVTTTYSGTYKVYEYADGQMNSIFEQSIADENVVDFGLSDSRMILLEEGADVRVLYNDNIQNYDKSYEIEGDSRDGLCSPDGEHYFIVTVNSDEDLFSIYETDTHKKIGEFTTSRRLISGIYFIDNDTIFVATEDNHFVFYSISTQDKEVIDIPLNDPSVVGQSIAQNYKYTVVYDFNNANVYDLEKREIIYSEMISYDMYHCGVSNNGNKLYIVDSNQKFHIHDLENNKDEIVPMEKNVLEFDVSPEDKYIAIHCEDNTLHILNLATLDEVTTLDYAADSDGYIRFSNDNKYIYTQSANKIFRIYDIETDKMVLISEDFKNEIRRTSFDEKSGILAVITTKEMVLIDMNSVGLLAYVSGGRLFIPEKNQLLSASGSEVWVYHFMDADELIKEACKRYGDERLTDEQKLLYGI